MRQDYHEAIETIIANRYIENVTDLKTGNRKNYDSTINTLPYIFTAKGFRVIAEIYAAKVQHCWEKSKNTGVLAKLTVLSDPHPLHDSCDYSESFNHQFKFSLQKELLIGEIELFPIHGGHATLIGRQRVSDNEFYYLHFDSSTGIGGTYPPAVKLYEMIRHTHKDCQVTILANYDRTQKTTPGCHVHTLYVMLQMALSLASGDKSSLAEFNQHRLTDDQKNELIKIVIPDDKHLNDRTTIKNLLKELETPPNNIIHCGLGPEQLVIAQTREIFGLFKSRQKDPNHPSTRETQLFNRLQKNIDPKNNRFNNKYTKTLIKMLNMLVYYNRLSINSCDYNNQFDLSSDQIDKEVIHKIVADKNTLSDELNPQISQAPYIKLTN